MSPKRQTIACNLQLQTHSYLPVELSETKQQLCICDTGTMFWDDMPGTKKKNRCEKKERKTEDRCLAQAREEAGALSLGKPCGRMNRTWWLFFKGGGGVSIIAINKTEQFTVVTYTISR